MSAQKYKKYNTRDFMKLLESLSKPIPFLDPDYRFVVIEESTVPIIVLNKKELSKLWEKVVGVPYEDG